MDQEFGLYCKGAVFSDAKLIAIITLKLMNRVTRKPVFGVSDHVRHKLGCTATEDG